MYIYDFDGAFAFGIGPTPLSQHNAYNRGRRKMMDGGRLNAYNRGAHPSITTQCVHKNVGTIPRAPRTHTVHVHIPLRRAKTVQEKQIPGDLIAGAESLHARALTRSPTK